jgi:large conductance mechanosensitive channel
VIGLSFGQVVQALVKDLITPLISYFGRAPDFESLQAGPFRYGDFANVLVSFVVVAAVVYFLIVRPYAAVKARYEPPPRPKRSCPYCQSEIAETATRCAFCTSELSAAG